MVNRYSPEWILGQLGASVARALDGRARLWKVWWLAGPPVILSAYWLGLAAEAFRHDEAHFTGALIDTLKFLACLMWLTVAWRCSSNVGKQLWSRLVKVVIVLGILLAGLTY